MLYRTKVGANARIFPAIQNICEYGFRLLQLEFYGLVALVQIALPVYIYK